MLIAIRIIATVGAFMFCALLLTVVLSPDKLERSTVDFAKKQIEAELVQLYPSLDPKLNSGGLQLLADLLGSRQARIADNIENGLPEMVSSVISKYCGCTAGTEKKMAERTNAIREVMEAQIQRLGLARDQLSEIIKGKYDVIFSALSRDIIIFLATNLAAFTCILGATFVRNSKRPLLIYPSLLLVLAVTLSSALYIFNTNWFYAIIFQDYWGYGYSAMLFVIFGVLLDIAANRARVTMQLVSNLPSALVPVC